MAHGGEGGGGTSNKKWWVALFHGPGYLKHQEITDDTVGDKHDTDEKEEYKQSLAGRLNHLLHGHTFHAAMLVLLVIDLLVVAVSITIEVEYLHSKIRNFEDACDDETCREPAYSHYGNHGLHDAEKGLMGVSVAILCIFAVENLLLFALSPADFVRHPLQIMDFCVVVLSIFFELGGTSFAAIGGILIFARAWRFVRIGFAVTVLHNEDHKANNTKWRSRVSALAVDSNSAGSVQSTVGSGPPAAPSVGELVATVVPNPVPQAAPDPDPGQPAPARSGGGGNAQQISFV